MAGGDGRVCNSLRHLHVTMAISCPSSSLNSEFDFGEGETESGPLICRSDRLCLLDLALLCTALRYYETYIFVFHSNDENRLHCTLELVTTSISPARRRCNAREG